MTTMELVDTFEPIPLDQLHYYWIHDGLVPVFTATVPDICKHIEAYGFQIYYVIATEKYKVAVSETFNKVEERPQIFKVNNTIVGRSVIPAGDDLKLEKMEATAFFALPKIPYYLIEKLDDFFRLIDEKLGTESIVILTFDTSKFGPEGWGVVVPDQQNTSVDCDYNPQSIIDELPADVYQVGSAHSHPGMSAYASGTDHKDQANFDGVHITFGWQKAVNNGITQYHIELQSGGKSFPFNAEQVFEAFPAREPGEDVQEWAKKVSKKSYQGSTSGPKNGGTTTMGMGGNNIPKNVTAPIGCPDLKNNIVIGQIKDNDTICPFCFTQMISVDRKKRRCMSCHQYICFEVDTLADIVDARVSAGVYTQDIDVIRGTATKPIYIWVRSVGGSRFDKVFDPFSGK